MKLNVKNEQKCGEKKQDKEGNEMEDEIKFKLLNPSPGRFTSEISAMKVLWCVCGCLQTQKEYINLTIIALYSNYFEWAIISLSRD